jgi:thiol-disulfide isomerase/thioredoxin
VNNFYRFAFASLLLVSFGCAPSPTAAPETINPNAEYKANVSTLYSLGTTSDGSTEIEWKGPSGEIQKLTDYRGKPVLLTFWRSSDAFSQMQIASLDSLAADMNANGTLDSVKVIAIADDNVQLVRSFQIVSDYVRLHGVKLQVIVDSNDWVQNHYVGTGSRYVTATYVLKPNGDVMTNGILLGDIPSEELKVWVRNAAK